MCELCETVKEFVGERRKIGERWRGGRVRDGGGGRKTDLRV